MGIPISMLIVPVAVLLIAPSDKEKGSCENGCNDDAGSNEGFASDA